MSTLFCVLQVTNFLLDGVQNHFYIAEDVRDVNEKSIFVHDFARGHQVELVKVDRLKSKAASAEDDRGKNENSIQCQTLDLHFSSYTLYIIYALPYS